MTRFRFRNLQIARPPKQNLGGEGPQTDEHLSQSPFTSQIFLDDDILLQGVYIVN